jgi:hypothetical protein
MATIRQLEESIFSKEGFRVTLEPLPGASKNLPPYEVEYPAYNRWKVHDWQAVRMQKYIPFLKSVSVLRPNGSRAPSTARIGNLRNAYFEQLCAPELSAVSSVDSA